MRTPLAEPVEDLTVHVTVSHDGLDVWTGDGKLKAPSEYDLAGRIPTGSVSDRGSVPHERIVGDAVSFSVLPGR